MKNLVILIIVSVFLYENALARDSDGRFTVYGFGQNLCGTMTEDVKKNIDGETAYKAYVEGYISAVNLLSPGKVDFFGYPLKAGHLVVSTRESHGLMSLPRPWHVIHGR